ncbi:MAG TPA: glycosyltransferase family 2 protein [Acidimicrobiales bacterium]|jgi:GT2 family glycosyltransferase|nr:glycosyltransferase family 2 protein [Acidimicrobiales bacterium]
MDAAPTAPPVVAVVVTHDAGPWLEECLAALREQDYPNLSVLVVDAASAEDPTPRVAAVLPSAYVRRLDGNPGFGPAANDVLHVVEGASHFVFCHDDVAPDPDAVRVMVEEAFRSNAGIVAPKLVQWDEPERLLQVGMAADKSGAPAPLNERGELDQEQHDAVRDVFVAPGGCTVVRADLFATLGGFDPAISLYGEDLDLSWRAQVAGARVIVAPGARVRHLEAMSSGLRAVGDVLPADPAELRAVVRPLQLRHRLRAVLKDYGLFHLLRVVPQVALLAVGEVLYGFALGRRRTSRDIVRAWRWNLQRFGEVRAARRALRKVRGLPDGEVRRLQARGSARMLSFVQGQLGIEERARLAAMAGRDVGLSLRALRVPLTISTVVAAVLLFGSRDLLSGRLPAVGEFAPFPDHVLGVVRPFLSGWRTTGLGGEGPAPAAFALLGLGGTLLLGGMGLLQKLLVVGMLPLGAVGAYRLARPLGSVRVRLAAMVVYLAIPLPYNAIARGRWSGLLVFGAAPWVLGRLAVITGLEPFGPGEAPLTDSPAPATAPVAATAAAPPGPSPSSLLGTAASGGTGGAGADNEGQGAVAVPPLPMPPLLPMPQRRSVAVVRLGLVVALLAAFVPSAPFVVLLLAVALVAGGLVAGGAGRAVRAVTAALGAAALAFALLFPWSLDFVLPGTQWAAVTSAGVQPGRGLAWGELLRFETGPLGARPLGWVFLLVAALPLVLGGGWRFAWAARLWTVAAVFWGVTWAGGRGWLPFALPPAEVMLAPAALALALAAGLGVAAFEVDLRSYRLGWRQVASVVAAGAAALGTLPVLGAAIDGRWHLPGNDHANVLSWMREHRPEGAFRVLWVGDPEALPLDGWRLAQGTAYATSRNGPPDVTDRWPGADPGTSGLIGDVLDVARTGRTTRLGHLLAPMAVRYVVVPVALAPGRAGSRGRMAAPPAPDLLPALGSQLDLRRIETDPSQVVYENAAWMPGRALLDDKAASAADGGTLEDAVRADLTGARPVLLREKSPTTFTGRIPRVGDVYLSEASSARWRLSGAERRRAFGWANAFTVDRAGSATLRYHTSPLRYLAVLIELGLWLLVVRFLVRSWRPRRGA